VSRHAQEQKDTLQEGRTTVLAHCPIRTSDLCITSATPYHLAKQAFDLMTDVLLQIIIKLVKVPIISSPAASRTHLRSHQLPL
jgi:hypothetical protein